MTLEQEEAPREWYACGESLTEFHQSDAFVRVLVGARGSGKTTGVTVEAIGHCWHNAGAKVMLLRKTETSQEDTTVATMGICFDAMGDLYKDTGNSLFKSWNNGRTFRIPSQKAVEEFNKAAPTWKTKGDRIQWMESEGNRLCGFIESRGLPSGGVSQSKLRGFECSMMVHIEADQIERKDFELSFACLRWKGSDPATCDDKGFIIDRSIIVDTNPPSPSHWIAKLEQEESEKPEHERKMRFWHISTYENEHNLPPNYIQDTILLPYARNSAMIERMLWGRYADAFDGSPVFYAYRPEHHEAQGLGWPRGATLVVGMDVGTNNASVISAFKVHNGHLYWWCLREIVLTGSDTDRQAIELLKVLANEFPFWNHNSDVCPQTLFFCDPAARNSSFTVAGPTSSALKVLQSHGIHPGMKTGVHLQPSIAACNRLMQQNHIASTTATVTNPDGTKTVWHFKIDTDKCPILKRAFSGEARYPSIGESGYGNDQPLKGSLCNHVDHVCFVAGTLVTTLRGDVPIECVTTSDMALTRKGWRRVVKSGCTSQSEMLWKLEAGCISLVGTSNHPIWIESQGWKYLASCRPKDRVLVCNQSSQLNSRESFTISTLCHPINGAGNTSPTGGFRFIERYGKTQTDQSQKGCTSTTLTETARTTRFRISKRYNMERTPSFTGKLVRLIKKHAQFAIRYFLPQACTPLFTARTTAKENQETYRRLISFTSPAVNAEQICGGTDTKSRWKRLHAKNVRTKGFLKRQNPGMRGLFLWRNGVNVATPHSLTKALLNVGDSVQINASVSRVDSQESTTLNGNASTAVRPSSPTRMTIERIALSAAPICLGITAPVYNITVEGAHEYYANGILVSNCDGFRYGLVNVLDIAPETHNAAMTPAIAGTVNPEPVRRI